MSHNIDTYENSDWFDLIAEKERHSATDNLIRSIYLERTAWSARKNAHNDKIRCCYATLRVNDEATLAWQTLLNYLAQNTDLLSIEPVFPTIGPQSGNTYLDALLHLAIYCGFWKRPLEDWSSESEDRREQFSSLARHLLANYFVPKFMDEAWFEGFTKIGEQRRNWFRHIGDGQNIRNSDSAIRLTKMAAHHFLKAPPEGSIVSAMRYGQVLGLGGNAFLAEAISDSKLGIVLPYEEFWESVVHFLVNHPRTDVGRVSPIIDYIFDRKFGEYPPSANPDFADAIEPTFSMKGRKMEPLWERVEAWHEELSREEKRGKASWEPSGLKSLEVSEPDRQKQMMYWTVRELCDSYALQKEGREMRHCVFTYRAGCLKGKTSIWSVRVRQNEALQYQRLLTVEVDNHRRAVVQVRGKCNKTLGSFKGKERMQTAGQILRRWAREQKLSIACSL